MVAPLHFVSIAADYLLQHIPPAIDAVDVAGSQNAPLQIAELIEHEQRMVAGAAETERVRSSPDSPLEGVGFELSPRIRPEENCDVLGLAISAIVPQTGAK